MEQPRSPGDHPCPQCGARRRADGTPSCACARQVSDALREARSAQAAAAGDFDPLRIRPYVELDGSGEPAAPARSSAPAEPDAAVPPRAAGSATPSGTAEQTSALPAPPAPPADAPTPTAPRPSDAPEPEPEPLSGPVPHGADGQPRRRRRGVVASVAAAAVAVAVAGYAGGLFSYETPSRDGALPQEVRAGVPEPSAGAVSPAPAPGGTGPSARPASASPSPSADASSSASAPASASASPSGASPSVTPSRSASPTTTGTTARPTGTAEQPQEEDDGHDEGGSVLRRGDRGPQVAELQGRLREVHLYAGDIDGVFDHRVEDAVRTFQWTRGIRSDEPGVYGPQTRQRLEAETSEPR
ncbi:hypothetical protein SUDANB58_01623 [Streptomyces sp. enrichment culture]|uniref:peptidoglycan-binding domain-containing protein n=1 Tax=Streptomyces sp. enrichment culture TaxID=1795815 RepID=UPI003F56B406